LIARGLTKTIILSRLIVGHTHADIDAKFALIWKNIRQKYVLTPQEYKNAIFSALNGSLSTDVEDIFVVPDYKSFFESFIDTSFSRYSTKI